MERILAIITTVALTWSLTGCAVLPQARGYKGPDPVPPSVERYYSPCALLGSETTTDKTTDAYSKQIISLNTTCGTTKLTYYRSHSESDEVILIFPMSGGTAYLYLYFAEYFASQGYDSLVFERDNFFKDASRIKDLEKGLQNTVRKDRAALDYIEKTLHRRMAAFGISRGAINAAVLASIDKRIESSVLLMGGTDIPRLYTTTENGSIYRLRRKVMKEQSMTLAGLRVHLARMILTDPKYLVRFLDSRKTLMFLALMDRTVPIPSGLSLRAEIGKPRTVFLFADHYTSLLYTQLLPLFPPYQPIALLPLDYVETLSIAHFDKHFERQTFRTKPLLYSILSAPFSIPARIYSILFD